MVVGELSSRVEHGLVSATVQTASRHLPKLTSLIRREYPVRVYDSSSALVAALFICLSLHED